MLPLTRILGLAAVIALVALPAASIPAHAGDSAQASVGVKSTLSLSAICSSERSPAALARLGYCAR
jgi:hypothetical protein